jgi:hypothetical protein
VQGLGWPLVTLPLSSSPVGWPDGAGPVPGGRPISPLAPSPNGHPSPSASVETALVSESWQHTVAGTQMIMGGVTQPAVSRETLRVDTSSAPSIETVDPVPDRAEPGPIIALHGPELVESEEASLAGQGGLVSEPARIESPESAGFHPT